MILLWMMISSLLESVQKYKQILFVMFPCFAPCWFTFVQGDKLEWLWIGPGSGACPIHPFHSTTEWCLLIEFKVGRTQPMLPFSEHTHMKKLNFYKIQHKNFLFFFPSIKEVEEEVFRILSQSENGRRRRRVNIDCLPHGLLSLVYLIDPCALIPGGGGVVILLSPFSFLQARRNFPFFPIAFVLLEFLLECIEH